MPILTFAKLEILEASRRRVLLVLLVLTLAIIVTTSWGFSKLWDASNDGVPLTETEVRLAASQLLIVVAFLFAAVLALSSVMVAAPAISADVESGLVLSQLARPVHRFDLAIGKWLGLAAILVVYAAAAGALELLGVYLTTGYAPPHPVQLIVYIAGVGLVLLTLALALSTRMAGMAGGIIGIAGYFLAWVGGIMGGLGSAIHNDTLQYAGLATKLLLPTDVLWRGAVFAMEPASVQAGIRAAGRLAAGNPFGVADPPATALLVWAVLWVVAVLALTWWGFRSREI